MISTASLGRHAVAISSPLQSTCLSRALLFTHELVTRSLSPLLRLVAEARPARQRPFPSLLMILLIIDSVTDGALSEACLTAWIDCWPVYSVHATRLWLFRQAPGLVLAGPDLESRASSLLVPDEFGQLNFVSSMHQLAVPVSPHHRIVNPHQTSWTRRNWRRSPCPVLPGMAFRGGESDMGLSVG